MSLNCDNLLLKIEVLNPALAISFFCEAGKLDKNNYMGSEFYKREGSQTSTFKLRACGHAGGHASIVHSSFDAQRFEPLRILAPA